MDWPSKVTLEFLELYKNEAVIWNPQHPSYKDRNSINEAWARIQTLISVETSVMELKGKKESLMATFRKVSNKVKADEDYKPPWFAYEFMDSFLNRIYTPRQTTTYKTLQYKTIKPKKEEDNDDDVEEEDEMDNQTNETVQATSQATNINDTVKTSASVFNRKRKTRKIGKVSGVSEPYTIFKRTYKEPEKDQCALYSELLATKLRDLDEKMRDFAMLEINNLMFRLKYQNNSEPDLPPCEHHNCSAW